MEVLSLYSNHGDSGKSTISLIEEATRCHAEYLACQTPSGNQTPTRPRLKVLTSSEVDELIAAYEAGDSTYVLAERFGIRRETVAGHLDRHSIMRRGNPRIELDAETRRMIIELGALGTPVRSIAKRFGLADRVVARTLDTEGIRRRTVDRKPKLTN